MDVRIGSRPVTLRRGLSRALSLMLVLSTACGEKKPAKIQVKYDPNVASYSLPLRNNPVDPGEAFRCFGSCQEQEAPDVYLKCLSTCPGFEVTQGRACEIDEIPPVSACITARRLERKDELPPGFVVVATIAHVALIVALASASDPNAGYYFTPISPY